MDVIKADSTFLYIAALTANIIAFICGVCLGWSSPEIPLLKNLTTSPLDQVITITEEGWLGSLLPLAAAFGTFGGGFLSNSIGRKKTLLFTSLPFIVSFAINMFAFKLYMFYVSRIICGLGVGISFTILPMYIGEISSAAVRGILSALMGLFLTIGVMFSSIVGPFLSIKYFNMILLFISIIYSILIYLIIPESPHYLILKGKIQEALKSLSKLRRKEHLANQELEAIQQLIDQVKINFIDVFSTKELRVALLITFGLILFQQLSGINRILFFSQSLFTEAESSLSPVICIILKSVVEVVGSSVTLFFIESKGKRALLILSSSGMALSQGLLSCYFFLKDKREVNMSTLGWIPILSINIFVFNYNLGFGILPWAIIGEIFPGHAKAVASSFVTFSGWLIGFLITNYSGIMEQILGKFVVFAFFSCSSIIAIFFVYTFIPETTGKSLQEIQLILNSDVK